MKAVHNWNLPSTHEYINLRAKKIQSITNVHLSIQFTEQQSNRAPILSNPQGANLNFHQFSGWSCSFCSHEGL